MFSSFFWQDHPHHHLGLNLLLTPLLALLFTFKRQQAYKSTSATILKTPLVKAFLTLIEPLINLFTHVGGLHANDKAHG